MEKAKRVNAWVLTDAQLNAVTKWLEEFARYNYSVLPTNVRGTIGLLVKREKRRRAGRRKRGD